MVCLLGLGTSPGPFRHPGSTFFDCSQSRNRLPAVLLAGGVTSRWTKTSGEVHGQDIVLTYSLPQFRANLSALAGRW